QLIPQAVQGLIELGADGKLAIHYGGILTQRARTGRNGARWEIDTVTSLELRGADRASALAEMTELYRAGVGSGGPGHDGPAPARQRETQIRVRRLPTTGPRGQRDPADDGTLPSTRGPHHGTASHTAVRARA